MLLVKKGQRSKVKYSKDYTHGFKDNVYYRNPNHLMCWKTSLARQRRYLDITIGEDTTWANRMKNLINTEYNIDEVLYIYNAR